MKINNVIQKAQSQSQTHPPPRTITVNATLQKYKGSTKDTTSEFLKT